MQWILKNLQGRSVLYFADDDNTYDLSGFTDDWFASRKFPVDMAGKCREHWANG
jgi:hypothetical protein